MVICFSACERESHYARENAEFNRSIVTAGSGYSMAVKHDGSLWTWGTDAHGGLGDATDQNRSTPAKVMDDVIMVDTGHDFSIAVKADRTLWAWGSIDQFGFNEELPVKLMDGVISAVANQYDIAYLQNDGTLWTWGNLSGMVSLWAYICEYGSIPEDMSSTSPLKIMDHVIFAATGGVLDEHILAIRMDKSLWAWGSMYGTREPTWIMDDVVYAAAGGSQDLAIKTDGSLWGWGKNYYGNVGNGTKDKVESPVKIMEDVTHVTTGFDHTMAIQSDGSLWSWGMNNYGQLGDGTISTDEENHDQYSPMKIMEDVVFASAGFSHNLAVKKDGSVWSWGQNYCGQLGDGTEEDRAAPVRIKEVY